MWQQSAGSHGRLRCVPAVSGADPAGPAASGSRARRRHCVLASRGAAPLTVPPGASRRASTRIRPVSLRSVRALSTIGSTQGVALEPALEASEEDRRVPTREDPAGAYRQLALVNMILLSSIVLISLGLTRLALGILAPEIGNLVAWSPRRQISVLGLPFRHAFMTVPWPLVIGTQGCHTARQELQRCSWPGSRMASPC